MWPCLPAFRACCGNRTRTVRTFRQRVVSFPARVVQAETQNGQALFWFDCTRIAGPANGRVDSTVAARDPSSPRRRRLRPSPTGAERDPRPAGGGPEATPCETPDSSGFNVGINCGEAAGQTIFHCDVHLIPRRVGDVANPRGGVRGGHYGEAGVHHRRVWPSYATRTARESGLLLRQPNYSQTRDTARVRGERWGRRPSIFEEND